MGYHLAGFDVVGIDIVEQPHYPFAFYQGDAIEGLLRDDGFLDGFDAIHASPPCQSYATSTSTATARRLIGPVRQLLSQQDRPWVIENLPSAERWMQKPVLLCGLMFGRPIARHRLFESSIPLWVPEHPRCHGSASRYAREHGLDRRDVSVTGNSRRTGSIDVWREIMDMPWAGRARDLSEAIYPAYTQWLGQQLYAAAALSS